jgi:hypothetical protein
MAWVGQGGLVVAGGDGPILLEPVEAAFDDVAALVDDRVEGGWASSGAAAAGPVGLLVDPLRDGRLDAATSQVGPVRAAGAALVGQHSGRPGRWPARPGPAELDCVQDLREAGRVVDVPASQ